MTSLPRAVTRFHRGERVWWKKDGQEYPALISGTAAGDRMVKLHYWSAADKSETLEVPSTQIKRETDETPFPEWWQG